MQGQRKEPAGDPRRMERALRFARRPQARSVALPTIAILVFSVSAAMIWQGQKEPATVHEIGQKEAMD